MGAGSTTIHATATTDAAVIDLAANDASVGVSVTGLTASGAALTPEVSNDKGTTWDTFVILNMAGTLVTSLAADAQFQMPGGHSQVRLRVTTTGTSDIGVAWETSTASALQAMGLS
jgi:hypothetical protein